MQKILIAYGSKSGTAKEAAEKLASYLKNTDLVDLASEIPNVEDYDTVIIGGGVRIGKVPKSVQRFVELNQEKILSKKSAFFITNSFIDSVDEIFDASLPQQLKEHAIVCASFGGRLDMDKLKGPDKLIAKMVSKSVDDTSKIYQGLTENALRSFADLVK